MADYEVKGFEEFRHRATDANLSNNEKSGFPDAFRKDISANIIQDWEKKIPSFSLASMNILDIGPGCSDLPRAFMDYCGGKKHSLTLIDSEEMLGNLPDANHVKKIKGLFPDCMEEFSGTSSFDIIIAYSVLQYIFKAGNLFQFIDKAASLLNEGGYLLLGDIPNSTRRKRFLSSEKGRRYHQQHYDKNGTPKVIFNAIDHAEIDDGVILGILFRLRLSGFDCFVMPQSPDLPMANRREDILIYRP